jgi:hypothetical protein
MTIRWKRDFFRAWVVFAVIVSCATLVHSQTLDFQAMCATQAQKAFQEWEIERTKSKLRISKDISTDYQSHYNTKLKKCFILIETNGLMPGLEEGEFLFTKTLSDAYERRVYASYGWVSRTGQKYWEVPPTSCELIPSFRQKKFCKTQEEFDDFVAQYMEE